jgi:hypothetical protein
MKATLTFNLPDDEADFHDAVEGTSARNCIFELVNLLRDRDKYGKPGDIETPEDAYRELRSEVYSILEAHGIDMDR